MAVIRMSSQRDWNYSNTKNLSVLRSKKFPQV